MKLIKPSVSRVVLVDDDVATNFIHEQVLQDAGFAREIVPFQRADEALEHLQRASDAPDLLLLDLNMPGMDGWEFLDALASLDPSALPKKLVVLTTSLNPDHKVRAEADVRITAFLTKPLSADALVEVLAS